MTQYLLMFINSAVKPHTLLATAPYIQLFKVLEQKMGGWGGDQEMCPFIHEMKGKVLHDLKKKKHSHTHTLLNCNASSL